MTRYRLHYLVLSAISNIRSLSCLPYCSHFFRQQPPAVIIPLANMPSRRQGNSANPRTSGSASANVPVSPRAARIGLIFGRCGTEFARLISEEEADSASFITWPSLEYIVLRFSSLPQGCTRTAGTLEVFFDFLILVGDVRIGRSPSAVGHHCRESLVFPANRVREAASRSLVPPLAREMMIIVFLATSESSIRRTLFDF